MPSSVPTALVALKGRSHPLYVPKERRGEERRGEERRGEERKIGRAHV